MKPCSFNAVDNPNIKEEFFEICEDYNVPHDPMAYKEEKFYCTYQTHWIIENSQGFTDVGLLRISESVRAYANLILIKAVLNNF